VGPRVGLDAVSKGKKFVHCLFRELNPGRLAHSLVTIPTELPRLLLRSRKKALYKRGNRGKDSD
jgi:hypothetical protein